MAGNVDTKERILDEAARLVRLKGFGATSVRDLLDAVGLKKGSLYFHFASKRDLGLALLERARAGFAEFRQAALEGDTPETRLYHFFDAALTAHRNSGFVGGCLWGNTALEMSDIDAQYASFVAEVFGEWVADIEAVITDGQAQDQFRTDLPPRHLARHVVAAIEGGIMLSRLTKDAGPLKDCLGSLKTLLEPPSTRTTD